MLALQDHLEAANLELWQMKAKARAQLGTQIRARLTTDQGCALVAEHPQEGIVGVIFGRVATNKRYVPARAGIVDQLFVHEDHRRVGLGLRLVAALCRFFAEHDIDDLSLRYVVGNTEASGFWAALGFTPRILTVGASRKSLEAHLDQLSSP
jgi:GNAT superfamily N-acetyltransferase